MDPLERRVPRHRATDLQAVVDEANRLFEGADFRGLFTREAVERSLRS